MNSRAWVKGFDAAVTVCDVDGRIIEMNEKAAEIFKDGGGAGLVGTNVLDCHPEPSRSKLRDMMQSRRVNVYTIKKSGRKKLIYQAPWYDKGAYAGFVELAFEIPWEMPHYDRDAP